MKTVIITLLLTAASVMSCKPPMPPTDNESACTSSCKQDQRTADVIGEADIITGIASDDFPSLFIQGNHFQFQRKNGLYAPLGIGFMEVIAEQNPVIPLYRTATCKEPEDSIALHQYPFDKDIAERKRKDDNPQAGFTDRIRRLITAWFQAFQQKAVSITAMRLSARACYYMYGH